MRDLPYLNPDLLVEGAEVEPKFDFAGTRVTIATFDVVIGAVEFFLFKLIIKKTKKLREVISPLFFNTFNMLDLYSKSLFSCIVLICPARGVYVSF